MSPPTALETMEFLWREGKTVSFKNISLSSCMWPAIEKGDILFLSPAAWDAVHPGEIIGYVSRKSGSPQLIIHRLLKKGPGYFIARGDCNIHPDPPVPDADYRAMVVRVHKTQPRPWWRGVWTRAQCRIRGGLGIPWIYP
jgi:signal peptidase I